MPNFSPRRANNFMLLSILFGNILVYMIYHTAANMLHLSPEVVGPFVDLITRPQVAIVIGQLSVTVLPFVVYLSVTGQRVSDVLPLKPVGALNLFLIALITITLMPLATLFNIITMLALGIENNVGEIVDEMSRASFGVTFLIIAIMPSIFEEITMRGIILSNYRNVDIHKAALVNGLFFGIFHLNPIQFLYAFLLGYVFALMVFYTKSIYSAIFAHFVFNGTQLLIVRFAQEYQYQMAQGEIIAPDIAHSEMVAALMLFYVIVAVIFTPVAVLLFKSFKVINRKNLLKEEFETLMLEADDTGNHSGLDVVTFGSARFDSADFDPAHVKLPESDSSFHEGGQGGRRIITLSFVITIVLYIIFVAIAYGQ